MLRATQIHSVLKQVNTEGVQACLLMTKDGALLGSAYEKNLEEQEKKKIEGKVMGAITSNIWSLYENSGEGNAMWSELGAMIIDLEDGKISMYPAGEGFLVCALADKNVHLGKLQAKLLSLSLYLDECLRQISLVQTSSSKTR